jgi:hypothetical protein
VRLHIFTYVDFAWVASATSVSGHWHHFARRIFFSAVVMVFLGRGLGSFPYVFLLG